MKNKMVRFGLVMLAMTGWCLPTVAAEPPIDIQWEDLVPEGVQAAEDLNALLGIHDPGDAPLAEQSQIEEGQVVTEYNEKTIRIPGYLLPLDFGSEGSTQFLLVPYVGACIHVPPPPANQIVLVTTETPYQSQGLFEPVYVTGLFNTAITDTEYAEVAYALSAEDIEAFVYE